MYGQMTAGSWIYIGSQGIVQGTFETFAAAGERHFGGSLEGKLLVTGGLGGMGGAQPLAATMAGARFLGIEVDPARIEKRLTERLLRQDRALARRSAGAARKARKKAISVGLVGNCADVLPEMVRRGIVPDVLTDQTSAHDALNGYVPNGMSLAEALAAAREKSGRICRAFDARDGRRTSRRCSRCRRKARSLSITATTSAPRRKKPAAKTPSIFPASFRNTSGRFFARGKGRSAGSR